MCLDDGCVKPNTAHPRPRQDPMRAFRVSHLAAQLVDTTLAVGPLAFALNLAVEGLESLIHPCRCVFVCRCLRLCVRACACVCAWVPVWPNRGDHVYALCGAEWFTQFVLCLRLLAPLCGGAHCCGPPVATHLRMRACSRCECGSGFRVIHDRRRTPV